MSELLTWFVGNRNPSITETIEIDAAPVDLTGKTVRFKARRAGGTALAVDQLATIVNSPGVDGQVRYDWQQADIDSGGILATRSLGLCWWEVTTTSGGRKQDMMEALFEVRDHLGLAAYVEVEEFKNTLSLEGSTHADLDIQGKLVSASRGVDEATGRRFYLDADATQVRYYSPDSYAHVDVDDIAVLTSFKTTQSGGTAFTDVWVQNRDFVLEPLNNPADGKPWETVCRHPLSSYRWGCYPRSVQVTAQFGWPAVPQAIKDATTMIAARLMRRARDAPFGVITVGQDGEAVRISQFDPDVAFLLRDYIKAEVFV